MINNLNNHISEVINDEQQEKRSAEHIDEVLEEIEKKESVLDVSPFANVLEQWITNMTGEISAKKDKTEEDIQLTVLFLDGTKLFTKGFKNVDEAKESLKIGGWSSYNIYKGKDLVACGSNGVTIIPAKEENKGMSTRHKTQQEKEVIDNWNRNKDDKNIRESFIGMSGEMGAEFGKKETNNKVDYSEIDWNFIEGLAQRMNKNKEKYEPFNYHKPMDVNLLKQSLLRHTVELLKGNYEDAGQDYGHLYAVSLNSMMIYYQLKNNQN